MPSVLAALLLSFSPPAVCDSSQPVSSGSQTQSIRACLDTCYAFHDMPGYELNRCVAQCQQRIQTR